MQDSIELKELICEKCSTLMAYGNDSDEEGEYTPFTVVCICGKKNNMSFFGYPKLFGTPEVYFDFTDEFEITCKAR